MLGKAFSKAKELTSKGLSKSKEYAKDKVHEQKRKIAVDVINSTDNKVKTKQEHLHLDRARQIVATKFNDGGGVGDRTIAFFHNEYSHALPQVITKNGLNFTVELEKLPKQLKDKLYGHNGVITISEQEAKDLYKAKYRSMSEVGESTLKNIFEDKMANGGGVGKKVKLTGFKVEGSLYATNKNKIPFEVVINGVKASGYLAPKYRYTYEGVDINELLVNGKRVEITSGGGNYRSYELSLGKFKEKEKQPKNLQFTGPYYELSDLGTKFKTKLLDIINNKPELLTEDFKKVFNITTNTEKQYSNGSKLMMEGGITNGDVSNSKFIYTIGGL
jgi:hypothetical protein